MIKKLKNSKKLIIVSALAAFMVLSTTAMAGVSVSCSVSKSGLKKSATAEGYSCAAVGCIIYGNSGQTLASGENGYYNSNSYRTKSVSYTGLSGADYAWAYAINTSGTSATNTVYY